MSLSKFFKRESKDVREIKERIAKLEKRMHKLAEMHDDVQGERHFILDQLPRLRARLKVHETADKIDARTYAYQSGDPAHDAHMRAIELEADRPVDLDWVAPYPKKDQN